MCIRDRLSPNEILGCLINSGVNINQNIGPRIDAYAALLCALPENNNPIPAFTASPQTTYENQAVTFINNSVNATDFLWSFEGGNPNSYDGENPPEIYYSDLGEFNVSLTTSNNSGNETLTKEDLDNKFN